MLGNFFCQIPGAWAVGRWDGGWREEHKLPWYTLPVDLPCSKQNYQMIVGVCFLFEGNILSRTAIHSPEL